jgi:hypothetical protein
MARHFCRMMLIGVGIYAAWKFVAIFFSTSSGTCGDCDIVCQALYIASPIFLAVVIIVLEWVV